MEISRTMNTEGSFDYSFKEGKKTLKILYGGNLDLYFTLGNGESIPDDAEASIDFDITKENYEIYKLFDDLYNEVINGQAFDPEDEVDDEFEHSFQETYQYSLLVDEDKTIHWISDDGPQELEDSVKFYKVDDDTYSIIVRFSNSGSSYEPFNCAFMRMYQKLQNVDPQYHQVHLVELDYAKRLKNN